MTNNKYNEPQKDAGNQHRVMADGYAYSEKGKDGPLGLFDIMGRLLGQWPEAIRPTNG